MKLFDFEDERVKQEVIRLGAKRVLIQLPEGLKSEGLRLSRMIEKVGALPLISADTCYGACDLATAEAESLNVDLIIHYGHAKLLKYERVPTIYVEARALVSVSDAVKDALPKLKRWRKIGLATTIQHVQAIDEARDILLRAGKTVMVGDAGRMNYPGQVIGCDYSNVKSVADDVEAFLLISGGRFHALGVALSTLKPTVVADPFEGKAQSVDEEAKRIFKQRWASIEEAKRAKTFAILVGLKVGQRRLEEALSIKSKLEAHGRTASLLVIREIAPESLMEFPAVDAFVNTACPRVSLDSASKFHKPVLTIGEVGVVIGETLWEELCRRGLLENLS